MPPTFELPRRIDSGLLVALRDLIDSQSGVARRNQLHELGVSRATVENMLAAGRWRGRGQIVVVMHNGPLSREQRLWAVVLNVSELVALAARTAATQQGLVGWDADCVEIVVRRSTVVPPGLGIPTKVHESRRFTAEDLHAGRLLPQVRIERALIDGAAWSRRQATACGLLAAGVQQRLTTAPRLQTELAAAGAIRHRRLLSAALIDIDGGAQAMSEVAFLRFCRRHGLPRPLMQEVRLDHQGRRRYLDATFQRGSRRPLRVEIDGALHLVVRTYWDDMSRSNELVIGKESVLRFPSYVIHANDPEAVSQLRRALNVSDSLRVQAS